MMYATLIRAVHGDPLRSTHVCQVESTHHCMYMCRQVRVVLNAATGESEGEAK